MNKVKKWLKAKRKADKAIALERSLRKDFGDLALRGEKKRTNIIFGDLKLAIQKKVGYNISSANVKRLKSKLPEDVFNDLFYVSYSIRERAYNNLTLKHKKKVDKLMTIREAPYQINMSEK